MSHPRGCMCYGCRKSRETGGGWVLAVVIILVLLWLLGGCTSPELELAKARVTEACQAGDTSACEALLADERANDLAKAAALRQAAASFSQMSGYNQLTNQAYNQPRLRTTCYTMGAFTHCN